VTYLLTHFLTVFRQWNSDDSRRGKPLLGAPRRGALRAQAREVHLHSRRCDVMMVK